MAKQKAVKKGGNPLRRNTTPMLVMFLTPAVLLYLIVFLYPTIRTFIMSFCKVEGVTDPVSTWQFSGLTNYVKSFNNNMFQTAMLNLGRLWLGHRRYGAGSDICSSPDERHAGKEVFPKRDLSAEPGICGCHGYHVAGLCAQ